MEQQRVGRAKRGEIQAFEELLEPNIATAHRYATALLHDSNLAEDAVQEACVRAWRKLDQLRPDSRFLPWFLGIVGNQCREQMRSRWWRVLRLPHSRALNAELPEDAAMRRAALREALRELTEREREIVILRLYLDLPWSDVASVAGLSEAGARTRYYRALERLRGLRSSREVLT
ncbi:MAG TPA: sigma-70 family RNA polymerase sigma factor [Candidatus Dormibacteraeota bacterium]|nr:sigma-70 family RNA polymerase sigma factor [Candidatus Dormibacteraeota bacterium]